MPGLGFWDTGEFQALGPVLGIAHPTGYPSYTLLLWLASVVLQPFGDPALRANLLSAVLVSGAARWSRSPSSRSPVERPSASSAGALLAVAPIAWRNAVRADPHGFHLFLAALLLVLLLGWALRERSGDPRAGRWLVAAAVCFGVSLGNHALTLLLAPGVALFVLAWRPGSCGAVAPGAGVSRWRWSLTTVVVYAYMPIRVGHGAAARLRASRGLDPDRRRGPSRVASATSCSGSSSRAPSTRCRRCREAIADGVGASWRRTSGWPRGLSRWSAWSRASGGGRG